MRQHLAELCEVKEDPDIYERAKGLLEKQR
jgi:hypothetical protein